MAEETMTRIKISARELLKEMAQANRRPMVQQLSIIIEDWADEHGPRSSVAERHAHPVAAEDRGMPEGAS